MGKKLLLNIPEKDFEKIETLVNAGEFETRTDAIRYAIKQLLYSEERMKRFEEATKELQKQTKKMGLAKKDVLKEVEEIRKLIRKKYKTKKDLMKEIEEAKKITRRLMLKK